MNTDPTSWQTYLTIHSKSQDMFTSLDPVIFLLLDYLYKSPNVGEKKFATQRSSMQGIIYSVNIYRVSSMPDTVLDGVIKM